MVIYVGNFKICEVEVVEEFKVVMSFIDSFRLCGLYDNLSENKSFNIVEILFYRKLLFGKYIENFF